MKKKGLRIIAVVLSILMMTTMMPQTGYAAKESGINKTRATILVSKTVKLSVNGKTAGVKWHSSNKKIAKVSPKGVVKGLKPGKATIQGKLGKKVYKCKVKVKKGLTKTNVSLKKGQSVKIRLCGTKIKKVSSSNKKVATATKKGIIKAVAEGSSTITFTGKDKKKYKCKVTVRSSTVHYFVTFNSNGGSAVPKQKIEKGKTVKIPADPTRSGFEFVRWELNGNKFDFNTPITSNITLVALWEENEIDNLQDNIVDRGDLQVLSENDVIDVSYGDNGSVEDIDGKFTNTKVYNSNDAEELMDEETAFLKDFHAYSCDITTQNNNGESYYRMAPTVDGVPVLGSQVILSASSDGDVTGLTSSYDMRINDVSTYTDIDEEDAIDAALDAVMGMEEIVNCINSNVPLQNKTYEDLEEELRDAFRAEAMLLVYAADEENEPRLVYQVIVTGPFADDYDEDNKQAPVFNMTVYVNANDEFDDEGSVYQIIDNSESWTDTTVSSGSISDVSGHTLNVQKEGDTYRLRDRTRGIGVYKTKHSGALWWSKLETLPGDYATGGTGLFNKADAEAVYSMVNIRKAYDYYNSVLNRKSFDGNGAPVTVSYDYYSREDGDGHWLFGWKYENACWCSGDYQQFLIGNEGKFYKGADVLGHEYTHAVISNVVGNGYDTTLTYRNQSGALNEAYADIIGNLIEGKSDGGRWLMGEDTEKAIRSMEDPSKYNDPKHYKNRYTGSDDNGGVHTNCTIFSHAAYRMMTDNRTSGISRDKWAKIYYDSLFKLTTDANFRQARRAVLFAANKNGLTRDQQDAIKSAYDAVGITEPDSTRIVLTWGSTPADLDSHLVGPTLDQNDRFHVYFEEMRYFDNDKKKYVADLDYDDTTSYGPEVTTIHDTYPGEYYFYVHDYTTGSSNTSKVMGQSNAKVRIYRGANKTPVKEFNITRGSAGTIWNVCKITINENNVNIDPINTYGADATYE